MEVAHDEVADQRDDKDGNKAVQQVEVLEHERITQAADHAEPALLRERADNERDGERDPEGSVLGAGALFGELEQRGHGDDQDEQHGYHSGQHAALGHVRLIRTLEGEALLQARNADENADDETGKADERVEVAAAETEHHAQRAAEEGQRADDDERTEHKTHRGGRARAGLEFLARNAHNERAEHETDDLGADILHLCGAVQAAGARNIAQKAGNTESHIRRVAERRQNERSKAHSGTGSDDAQMYFFHFLNSPISFFDTHLAFVEIRR